MKQTRANYVGMFGPTTGDQVRLADTELFIEVERDLIAESGGYGNEVRFGGGKVIRDGMAQSPLALDADSLDLVITNALILDAAQGIIKADIGIKHGRIVGIGHAGNPLLQDGITMTIGAATEVIAGEGCIITAGGIDTAAVEGNCNELLALNAELDAWRIPAELRDASRRIGSQRLDLLVQLDPTPLVLAYCRLSPRSHHLVVIIYRPRFHRSWSMLISM